MLPTTVHQLTAAYRRGELSAVEVVQDTGPKRPIGLQVVATLFRKDLVLRACRAILDITGWTWSPVTPG